MLCFPHRGKVDGAPMCNGFCAGDHCNSTLSPCAYMYRNAYAVHIYMYVHVCLCRLIPKETGDLKTLVVNTQALLLMMACCSSRSVHVHG